MRENGVPYLLTAYNNITGTQTRIDINTSALTYATGGAADWSSVGWYAAPDGIVASSNLATSVVSRPQAHGSYIDASYREGVQVAFTLYNMALTAALRQSQQDDMLKLLDALHGDDANTYSTYLRWNPQGGGTERSLHAVRLVQPPQFSTVAGTLKSVSFIIQSPYPYACSPPGGASFGVVSTAAPAATGGGFTVPLVIPFTLTPVGTLSVAVANAGNTTWYPTFDPINAYVGGIDGGAFNTTYPIIVDGPCAGFSITRTVTGYPDAVLSFPTASVALGDSVYIDCWNRTATYALSGTTVAPDMSVSTWFGIPPGGATLTLAASAYSSLTALRTQPVKAWM